MSEVKELLDKKRDDYGDAVESMKSFAYLTTWYLKRSQKLREGVDLDVVDVCEIMCLFKLSREAGKRKPDMENWVDNQGYSQIAVDYIKQEVKK
jgi:hypothetical protein